MLADNARVTGKPEVIPNCLKGTRLSASSMVQAFPGPREGRSQEQESKVRFADHTANHSAFHLDERLGDLAPMQNHQFSPSELTYF
jgi:hypothetical protein